MIIHKVRNQNKIIIVVQPAEIALARKLGIPVQNYVKGGLLFTAQKRKWKWFLEK
jgi:hypothetical protein